MSHSNPDLGAHLESKGCRLGRPSFLHCPVWFHSGRKCPCQSRESPFPPGNANLGPSRALPPTHVSSFPFSLPLCPHPTVTPSSLPYPGCSLGRRASWLVRPAGLIVPCL